MNSGERNQRGMYGKAGEDLEREQRNKIEKALMVFFFHLLLSNHWSACQSVLDQSGAALQMEDLEKKGQNKR